VLLNNEADRTLLHGILGSIEVPCMKAKGLLERVHATGYRSK